MGPMQTPELPGFSLLRVIGRGSFGEVWIARTLTGEYRAVKIVRLGDGGVSPADDRRQELGDRVFRGVQAYLRHLPPGSSSALSVLHVDRDPEGRFFYYVMELADDAATGRDIDPERYQALTLSEFRRRSEGQTVPADETVRLGVRLAEGLAALHAAGLVHRDIKPNNIIFIGGQPRLADIDLVRPSEATLSIGGAPGYAPLEGPGRPTADVFSLGRTLYATVTGLPAGEFPRLPEDWDQRPDAEVLGRLNRVLLRACDRDPEKRYKSGSELLAALRGVERGEDFEKLRRSRRAYLLTTAVALTAIPLSAIAFHQFQRGRGDRQFAEYKYLLNRAANHLSQNDFEISRKFLDEAVANAGATLESELLRRQIEDQTNYARGFRFKDSFGVPAGDYEIHGASGSVEIKISDDLSRVAIKKDTWCGVYSIPAGKPLFAMTNIWILCGFLSPGNEVAGSQFDTNGGTVLRVWNAETGDKLMPEIAGDWIPAGILEDGRTLTCVPRSFDAEKLMRWRPLDGWKAYDKWKLPPYRRPKSDLRGPRGDGTDVKVSANKRGNIIHVFDNYPTNGRFEPGAWPDVMTMSTLRRDITFPMSFDLTKWWPFISRDEVGQITFPPSDDGTCWINFSSTREMLRLESYSGMGFRRPQKNLTAAAIASDGKFVALGSDWDAVRILDGVTGGTIALLPSPKMQVSNLLLHRDTNLFIYSYQSSRMQLWELHPEYISRMRRKRFLKEGVDADLIEAHGFPARIAARFEEGKANRITWGHLSFAIGDQSGSLLEKVEKEFSSRQTPLFFEDGVRFVWAWSGGGSLALRALDEERLSSTTIYDRETPVFTNVVENGHRRLLIDPSSDRKQFFLYSENSVSGWEIHRLDVRCLFDAKISEGLSIRHIFPSADFSHALVITTGGLIFRLDLKTGAFMKIDTGEKKIITGCRIPKLDTWLLGTAGGQLLRAKLPGNDVMEVFIRDFGTPDDIVASDTDNRIICAGSDGKIKIFRLSDGSEIVEIANFSLTLEAGRHNLKRIFHLPKERKVFTLSADGWLSEW